jgi:polar amino acid transport system substrate-binding protein
MARVTVGRNDPTKGFLAFRRFAMPAIGGVLGLLALLPPAHARGQPDPADTKKAAVRVLAVARTPLADEHLAEGGLIVALARASLAQSGSGGPAGTEPDLRWIKPAPAPPFLNEHPVDVALPVEGADCDHPNVLTQSLAMLCDNAVFSDPLLQVVVGLFAPARSAFKFDSDEAIVGKTICVVQDHDVSALNGGGRNWVSFKRVSVLRRPTLLDCVVAAQAGEADAFAATDLEGRFLLTRLGLAQSFTMQARPLATRGVHAVAARDNARAEQLIGAINRGLKRLKQSGEYATIVQKHMTALWDGTAARPPPSAFATTAATSRTPGAQQGPGPSTTGPATAPLPKGPPAIGAADRARALRYMKKGDEELGEGRVAPARLLYERAADMGIPQAAMAMAATYDADELNKLGLVGIPPDAALAKRWYERARALGAKGADRRLQRLGAN